MKLPAYPKYKPSGVEWLGSVPEHWKVKAIKWESPVLRGASPRPIDDPRFFDDEGEFAWVRISDVTTAGMYLETTEEKLSTDGSSLSVKLNPGEIFLSIAGSVGKPCISRIKCCIHDGFVYFPRFKGEAKFLFYLFASGEPYRGLGKLGTQLNLNTDTVGSIRMGCPEKAEQQAIAAFLDRETGRLETLIGKKRQLIEKLKEKRTALISRTVTRGLNPNAKLKPSGIEWLGEIPAHWQSMPLKFIASVQPGFAFSSDDFIDEGIPVVRIGDIISDGQIDFTNAKCLPEEFLGTNPDVIVQRGDIAMAMTGATIGKVGRYGYEKPALLNQRVCLFRPNQGRSKDYLWYLLNSDFYIEHVELTAFGGAQPNISETQLLCCPVPVPPSSEQSAIATYLDVETAKIDRLVEKVEAAIEKLLEYRTALITAAVTGKIDVRGNAGVEPSN